MGKSIEVVEKWVGGLKAASYLINGYRRGGVGRQRRLNKKLNHRLININTSGQHRAFAVVLGKPSFSNCLNFRVSLQLGGDPVGYITRYNS